MAIEKATVPQETSPPALPLKLDVTPRLIEPRGNLVGFANVRINDAFIIGDFKILQNDKGLFVGMPSKPDKTSTSGYRDVAKPITADFRAQLTEAVTVAYHAEVEKLHTLAASIAPIGKQASIAKQMADAKKQADKDNTARPNPEKSDKGQDKGEGR